MRCSNVKSQISPWLDNELDSRQALKIAQHLQKCPHCQAYADQARKLNSLLQVESTPPLPEWIHNRIMQSASEHDDRRSSLRRKWNLQMIPAAMAVIMSMYFGALVGIHTFSTTNSTSNTETLTLDSIGFGESTIVALETTTGDSNE